MSRPTLLVADKIVAPADLPAGTIPVEYIVEWVVRHSRDTGDKARLQDRVLVVKSMTGSGKSTVLPVYLFRVLRSENTPERVPYRGKNVLCTQPRVMTAITLSTRDIPEYNKDMVLGKTIGFQTGPSTEKPPAGLIFATIGVLAAQLRTMEDSAIMARYKYIIVDEAHERSRETDVTLMRLKNFYVRNEGNPNLPFLFLASATIDVKRYAAFFGLTEANTVVIEGRTFPIEEHFPEKGTNDFVKEAVATAIRIHDQGVDDAPEKADIMIFIPGAAETREIVKALTAHAAASSRPFLVLPINREAVIDETQEYRQVLMPVQRLPRINGTAPARRIIVATTVAETGLTVPTLRYVIDSGWTKAVDAYQPYGIAGLISRPAPRSRILQRKGRAGRIFPGEFYPLYTRNVYDALDEQQLPEIITDGVLPIFLDIVGEQQRQKKRLVAAGGPTAQPPEFRVEDIDMLDPPPVEAIRAALEFALAAGFVSPAAVVAETLMGPQIGYGLTWLGQIAGRFSRTPAEGVRAILACYVWGCSAQDMITIVALFGTPVSKLLNREAMMKDPRGSKAILAGLPSFLTTKMGGGDEDGKGLRIPPSDSELGLYRSRLIIADDFIEALMVFDAFVGRLDSAGGDVFAVGDWCAQHGLDMEALIEVARQRDLIIEEVLAAGLDPFWRAQKRLSATPMADFTAAVSAAKRCLYDGLRQNLLRYDAKHNVYRTRHGLAVDVPPAFTDREISKLQIIGIEGVRKPMYLLTDAIKIELAKRPPAPAMYHLNAPIVSVLDGFVAVDADFLAPRPC